MSRIFVERYWEETEPPWDYADVPWLVRVVVRWAITIAGFAAADWIVGGFNYDGGEALLAASAIFVVLRALVRPILMFITCPLQLITLGLFVFVINAVIVVLTSWISDWWGIAFEVDGFLAAFLGALVISALSFVLSRLLRRRPFR